MSYLCCSIYFIYDEIKCSIHEKNDTNKIKKKTQVRILKHKKNLLLKYTSFFFVSHELEKKKLENIIKLIFSNCIQIKIFSSKNDSV